MAAGDDSAGRALRFTFSYQGGSVELLGQQNLDAVPPPSDALEDFGGQSGFWYELRDAAAQPLYRRVIENPVQFHLEGPPDDSESTSDLQRVPVESPQGMFTLMVPDLAEARTLALVSSPLDSATLAEPARDLAVFDLAQGVA
jgi:hypothetical protein